MHTKSHFFTWATCRESGGSRAYNLRIVVVLGHLIAGYRAYAQENLPFTEKKPRKFRLENQTARVMPYRLESFRKSLIDREDVIFFYIF